MERKFTVEYVVGKMSADYDVDGVDVERTEMRIIREGSGELLYEGPVKGIPESVLKMQSCLIETDDDWGHCVIHVE